MAGIYREVVWTNNVMLVFTLGITGALNIADNNSIIIALSPTSGLAFITYQP